MLDQGYYEEKKKQPLGWKIFFIILISAVIIVYLTLFLRFFQTCDSSDSKIVYLSEAAASIYNVNKESLDVYKLSPRNPITADGAFYMSFITYLKSTNELQITVKYRETVLEDKSSPYPYTYKLFDENGTEFAQYYSANYERQGYYYTRLCFTDLTFDFEEHTPIYLELLAPDNTSIAKMTLFDANTSATKLKNFEVLEIKQ